MHEHPFGNALDPSGDGRSLSTAIASPDSDRALCASHRLRTLMIAHPRATPDEPGGQARTPPFDGFALSGILIHRPVTHTRDRTGRWRCTIRPSRRQIGVLREMRGFPVKKDTKWRDVR